MAGQAISSTGTQCFSARYRLGLRELHSNGAIQGLISPSAGDIEKKSLSRVNDRLLKIHSDSDYCIFATALLRRETFLEALFL